LVMKNFAVRFVKDESAVTAIEYGLIAALVSITCIGAMSALGASLLATYALIEAALVGAV
jgi:pilus assembly protein Flp/PilA